MSWTDYIFGFGPKEKDEPSTPEQFLQQAVTTNNAEAVTRMLSEIQSPCERLDLAKRAQGENRWGEQALVSLAEHQDGTETLSMWRVVLGRSGKFTSPHGGNVVGSIDQPACKR